VSIFRNIAIFVWIHTMYGQLYTVPIRYSVS